MRKAIRLALPAVAAAMAFALTGCGDDDEGGGAFGGFGGGGENTEVPEGLEDLEGLEDIEIPDAQDSGGSEGGGDAAPEEESDASGGGTGGSGGGTPTVADLEGTWITGVANGDSTLSVTGGDVMFMEDTGAEGDICYGTATDGAITLDECSVYGDVEWSAMEASLTLDGDTLVVNWSDGTVQEYTTY